LGLLNAIAVGEADGHKLFEAWAETTADEVLRQVLRVVAIREAEHAAVFTKRIAELGFSVREKKNNTFQNRLELARSDSSDKKKFKKILGIGKKPRLEDRFADVFLDTSIDPITSALLGRYVAEERDSGRLLREARRALRSESA
ncbi:MAG: hypothetical protein ACC642_12215, partial [Pseudomonadales bacterium]